MTDTRATLTERLTLTASQVESLLRVGRQQLDFDISRLMASRPE